MGANYFFSADVDDVFDCLTDPDFLVERCVAMDEKNIQCDIECEGRKTNVQLTRTVVRDLPKVLAKLFGNENIMTMNEYWEEVGAMKMGYYTVKIEGQPVTLNAKFSLKPLDEGCEYKISYSAKANIPIVGKKVEAFILSQTEEGMKKEMDYLAAQLS